jgi:hypothetical protein
LPSGPFLTRHWLEIKMAFGRTPRSTTGRSAAPLAAAEPAEDAVQPDAEVREQPCHPADA